MSEHTPGPWRWAGEDYRGGWGWMLLVGPNGEGICCGEANGEPYKHLRAHVPIDPKFCKTGMLSDDDSAPCVHVREADARLIASAPDLKADNDRLRAVNAELLEALEAMLEHSCVADAGADMKFAEDHATERRARAAIAKAKGDDHA